MDELILRSARGQSSAPEEAIVTRWRQEAPENESAYQDLVRLVRAARRLDGASPVGAPPPVTGLLRQSQRLIAPPPSTVETHRFSILRRLRRPLAIAAVAASALIG